MKPYEIIIFYLLAAMKYVIAEPGVKTVTGATTSFTCSITQRVATFDSTSRISGAVSLGLSAAPTGVSWVNGGKHHLVADTFRNSDTIVSTSKGKPVTTVVPVISIPRSCSAKSLWEYPIMEGAAWWYTGNTNPSAFRVIYAANPTITSTTTTRPDSKVVTQTITSWPTAEAPDCLYLIERFAQ
ncbi:predicted protein [Aspergillus terreus NIH2624]|uniref:Ig-like domain-containing protein n=1 Tax=Aspergillus terreus (strain NIH 2624 / FGSC A1156) TaxID=341663 RepID=Q0CVX9_ASPTN|nr:uncharacterized protein ATEG_02155 [Aspergillus terreus NIH2624]EAU37117.1 predicted protein [Aspergillus terreus NIH2624]